MAINALGASPDGGSGASGAAGTEGGNWELDWPSLLYVPVGMPGRRPVGLLILGSRSDHWYLQEEIDYAASIGIALTSMALSVGGPIERLRGNERRAARFMSQGFSAAEMAVALNLDGQSAQRLVARVLRKLALRSPRELTEVWPEVEPLGPIA